MTLSRRIAMAKYAKINQPKRLDWHELRRGDHEPPPTAKTLEPLLYISQVGDHWFMHAIRSVEGRRTSWLQATTFMPRFRHGASTYSVSRLVLELALDRPLGPLGLRSNCLAECVNPNHWETTGRGMEVLHGRLLIDGRPVTKDAVVRARLRAPGGAGPLPLPRTPSDLVALSEARASRPAHVARVLVEGDVHRFVLPCGLPVNPDDLEVSGAEVSCPGCL